MPQEHARSRAEEEGGRTVRSDKEVPVEDPDAGQRDSFDTFLGSCQLDRRGTIRPLSRHML